MNVGPSASDLQVRNPAIRLGDQARRSTVTLSALSCPFAIVKAPQGPRGMPSNMAGYYKVSGPGLPPGPSVTAVLDCAMLFTVERRVRACLIAGTAAMAGCQAQVNTSVAPTLLFMSSVVA